MRVSLRIKRMRTVRKELKLFKYLMDKYTLRTDEELAEFMLCSKTIVSMTRCDHRTLSARLILVLYDKTDLSIEDIRSMAKEYA